MPFAVRWRWQCMGIHVRRSTSDLLALAGSGERILRCGRALGFTLEAAPVQFAGGAVRIRRLSKAVAEIEDVRMLDVLSVSSEIEKGITMEAIDWEGAALQTVDRASSPRGPL